MHAVTAGRRPEGPATRETVQRPASRAPSLTP